MASKIIQQEQNEIARNQFIGQKLSLYNDDGEIGHQIDLSEKDPIFHARWDTMIHESFAQGKHFIIAKIVTKKPQEGKNEESDHFHYFNAYGILKLIFQKKSDQFVGRFHERFPISAKNPVTGTRIVGEVEFYVVKNPKIEEQKSEEQKNHDNNTISPKHKSEAVNFVFPSEQKLKDKTDLNSVNPENVIDSSHSDKSQQTSKEIQLLASNGALRAEFVGTDFNFLYSEELQEMIAMNCLDANWAQLMDFKPYNGTAVYDDLQLFANRREGDLDFDGQFIELVKESFQGADKFRTFGMVGCLFYFCVGVSMIWGLIYFLQAASRSGAFGSNIVKVPYANNTLSNNSTDMMGSSSAPASNSTSSTDLEGQDQQNDENFTGTLTNNTQGYPVEEETENQPENIRIQVDLLCLLFPIVTLVYNYQLVSVYKRKELRAFLFIKVCLCIFFYISIVLAFVTDHETWIRTASGSLILIPLLVVLYSHLLFNNQALSRKIDQNGNNLNGANRAQAVLNEHFRQRNQAQVDFDRRHFGGGQLVEHGQALGEISLPGESDHENNQEQLDRDRQLALELQAQSNQEQANQENTQQQEQSAS